MATIIKSHDTESSRNAQSIQAVAFSFDEMSSQADNYLDSVRNQAAKIISDAHQQAEAIRRKAEQAGRQAAQDAIENILDEKIAKQMETLRPAIGKLVTDLEDARGIWHKHWEQSAVTFAIRIAERIIRREIEQNPEIAIDLIRESLELAAGGNEITVHMNPSDYESLGRQVEVLAETICQLSPATVLPDKGVSAGGCRVVTKFGEIDQQIETQLERIQAEWS